MSWTDFNIGTGASSSATRATAPSGGVSAPKINPIHPWMSMSVAPKRNGAHHGDWTRVEAASTPRQNNAVPSTDGGGTFGADITMEAPLFASARRLCERRIRGRQPHLGVHGWGDLARCQQRRGIRLHGSGKRVRTDGCDITTSVHRHGVTWAPPCPMSTVTSARRAVDEFKPP